MIKAAVLGVGTELVDGQIVNKNAAWISGRLKALGVTTNIHLVVPDDRALILDALKFLESRADWLFVTGGLGPTSDDFTRDLIQQWSGQPMQFHQPSWDHLSERMTSRGFTVKEVQRQQCYFPAGSDVLSNAQGTANGFHLQAHAKEVFVLPGPPREIASIWDDHIHAWLQSKVKDLDPYITRHWDFMGRGESDIADVIEPLCKDSGFEIGYRVHLPYVEVKLSHFASQSAMAQGLIEKITQALQPWLVTRDGGDVAQMLAVSLSEFPSFHIGDAVTGGFLLQRVMPFLREHLGNKEWSFSANAKPASAAANLLLSPIEDNKVQMQLQLENGLHASREIVSPYSTMNMRERSQQYFAESAVLFWSQQLRLQTANQA